MLNDDDMCELWFFDTEPAPSGFRTTLHMDTMHALPEGLTTMILASAAGQMPENCTLNRLALVSQSWHDILAPPAGGCIQPLTRYETQLHQHESNDLSWPAHALTRLPSLPCTPTHVAHSAARLFCSESQPALGLAASVDSLRPYPVLPQFLSFSGA